MVTLDPEKAMKAADYSHGNHWDVMASPRVASEITRRTSATMTRVALKGARWYEKALDSPKTADGIKQKITESALKYLWSDGGEQEKEPHEMTAAELASMQDKIRAELAKLPDVTPADAAPAIEHDKGDIFE